MKPLFTIGNVVYHRAGDDEQQGGIISGIIHRQHSISYLVSWADAKAEESAHTECELTLTRPVSVI